MPLRQRCMTWMTFSDNILHLSNHASNTKTLTLDNHATFDILADHQDHNHKPKAPSADHLCRLAAHHKQWPKQVVDSDEEEVVPDSEGELELDDMEEICLILRSHLGNAQDSTSVLSGNVGRYP